MICKNCNTEFSGNFCPVCGAAVIQLPEPDMCNSGEKSRLVQDSSDVGNVIVNEATEHSNGQQPYYCLNESNCSPVEVQDESETAYKLAAKRYWYVFLIPILFFIPITDKFKGYDCNKEVANNALWILIINVVGNVLATLFSSCDGISALSGVFSLIVTANGIFALVAMICALSGKGIKMPGLGKVRIVK